jgi:hypothetical protein
MVGRSIVEICVSHISGILDPCWSLSTFEALICIQNWVKPLTRFNLDEKKEIDVVENY